MKALQKGSLKSSSDSRMWRMQMQTDVDSKQMILTLPRQ